MTKFFKLVPCNQKDCDGEPHIMYTDERITQDGIGDNNIDFAFRNTNGSTYCMNVGFVRRLALETEVKRDRKGY